MPFCDPDAIDLSAADEDPLGANHDAAWDEVLRMIELAGMVGLDCALLAGEDQT